MERLFRINPYLEVNKWEATEKNKYFIDLTNHSQEPQVSLQTHINVTNLNDGLHVYYDNGIKSDTTIIAQALSEGSKLIITDHYHSLKDDEPELICSVDKSLHKWAEEIQNYLIYWQRWSWFLPWQIYKKHIWIFMKPAARRISFMLIFISLIEVALIGLGVIIYSIEYR